MKRFEDALPCFDRAISCRSDFAEAHYNRGITLWDCGHLEQGLKSFDEACAHNGDLPYLRGHRLHAKLKCHDWTDYSQQVAELNKAVGAGKLASMPFPFLSLSESQDDYLHLVRVNMKDGGVFFREAGLRRLPRASSRLRVGIISADFRDHPLAQALSSIIEELDRTDFEIFGVSIGPTDTSEVAQRIIGGCDAFHDVYKKGNKEAGDLLVSLDLDVLLVTAVHTQFSNAKLFVKRYSPIQVSFLSAWSSGCDFFDYMVADPRCVLDDDKSAYSEKIVSVRGFLSDQSQVISASKPSRQDCGLPDDAFVYCCFNDHYKINPQMFDSWMQILRKADGSVLWLKDNAYGRDRLRAEAVKRGVDSSRLIFAPRMTSISDHLARLDLADLTLDTLPYGGHTTMRDSLFAGVPVLTQYGKTFVGRIGASLLDDVGLNELITHSTEDYESLAVELAQDRAKLAQIRAKLKDRLASAGLFDTQAYIADLEAALRAMAARHRSGLPPDHISEASLRAFRRA